MAHRHLELRLLEASFKEIGREITGGTLVDAPKLFITQFGTTPLICCTLWLMMSAKLGNNMLRGACPKKLLWALLFLKTYAFEGTRKTICKADQKTIRKWTWYFIHQVAELAPDVVSQVCAVPVNTLIYFSLVFYIILLSQIKWENRKHGNTPFRCKVSVDGTDFRIREPSEWSTKWYTPKFNGPGLRYEVAVCINTGHIVWCHGPFACGLNPDIRIFRLGLKHALDDGERVECDNGYRGEPLAISLKEEFRNEEHRRSKDLARARHECINRFFKRFEVLHEIFRNDINHHSKCFWAVAVIVQLSIALDEKQIWQVDYIEGETYDHPLIDLDY